MKKLIILTICVVAVGMNISVFAQPAKPDPELRRLETLFLGTWKVVRTPVAAGEVMSAVRNCEWFSGGFQLVCNSEIEVGGGKIKGLSITSYEPTTKRYARYSISSSGGQPEIWTGTYENENIVWSTKFSADAETRITTKCESPTRCTIVFDESENGGPWKIWSTGRATKIDSKGNK